MSQPLTIDLSNVTNWLNGRKTYVTLAVGALVIVANHFGVLPPDYVPAGLNPQNWLNDLFTLALGATFRSALKKGESSASPPAQS